MPAPLSTSDWWVFKRCLVNSRSLNLPALPMLLFPQPSSTRCLRATFLISLALEDLWSPRPDTDEEAFEGQPKKLGSHRSPPRITARDLAGAGALHSKVTA